MDVVVTGSSGLIGSALVRALEGAGHRVRRMVRRAPGPDEIAWDPAAGTIDVEGLEGCGAVVHLAGAGIGDHRWSDTYKREIRESRTRSTALLSEALASREHPPKVLLSGSAIGFYGDRGDEVLTETSPPGEGFLADVCVAWEAATGMAESAGIRVAHLRTGIVLSPEGGALKKSLPLFKLGLGGRFGGGHQWWSWIALADEVAAILYLLEADVRGPVNLTAPNPVTNSQFTAALGRALGRPAPFPVPKFGPSMLLGSELAENLLFSSQRVLPTVLQEHGFTFGTPELEPALRQVLGRPPSTA